MHSLITLWCDGPPHNDDRKRLGKPVGKDERHAAGDWSYFYDQLRSMPLGNHDGVSQHCAAYITLHLRTDIASISCFS